MAAVQLKEVMSQGYMTRNPRGIEQQDVSGEGGVQMMCALETNCEGTQGVEVEKGKEGNRSLFRMNSPQLRHSGPR